mgnify:CR=1 FL=1
MREEGRADGGRAAGFHGFTAVAELKPDLPRERPAGTAGFPRLHRRGRIEAAGGRAVLRHPLRFPRLHRRGRIEARGIQKCGTTCTAGFHGFTAVAELKRWSDRYDQRRDEREGFHGFTAVAELKHGRAVEGGKPHLRGFHGFTAVAELKPGLRPHTLSQKSGFHGFTAVAELKLPPVAAHPRLA